MQSYQKHKPKPRTENFPGKCPSLIWDDFECLKYRRVTGVPPSAVSCREREEDENKNGKVGRDLSFRISWVIRS